MQVVRPGTGHAEASHRGYLFHVEKVALGVGTCRKTRFSSSVIGNEEFTSLGPRRNSTAFSTPGAFTRQLLVPFFKSFAGLDFGVFAEVSLIESLSWFDHSNPGPHSIPFAGRAGFPGLSRASVIFRS